MRTQFSKTVLGGLLGCGLALSGAANAQQVSLEQAVTNLMVSQSQQVVTELSQQLKQSITHGLTQFRIDVDSENQSLNTVTKNSAMVTNQKVKQKQTNNKSAAE